MRASTSSLFSRRCNSPAKRTNSSFVIGKGLPSGRVAMCSLNTATFGTTTQRDGSSNNAIEFCVASLIADPKAKEPRSRYSTAAPQRAAMVEHLDGSYSVLSRSVSRGWITRVALVLTQPKLDSCTYQIVRNQSGVSRKILQLTSLVEARCGGM